MAGPLLRGEGGKVVFCLVGASTKMSADQNIILKSGNVLHYIVTPFPKWGQLRLRDNICEERYFLTIFDAFCPFLSSTYCGS